MRYTPSLYRFSFCTFQPNDYYPLKHCQSCLMMMVELTKVMVDEFFSCQKSPGFLVHQHSLEIWRDESNTPSSENH